MLCMKSINNKLHDASNLSYRIYKSSIAIFLSYMSERLDLYFLKTLMLLENIWDPKDQLESCGLKNIKIKYFKPWIYVKWWYIVTW